MNQICQSILNVEQEKQDELVRLLSLESCEEEEEKRILVSERIIIQTDFKV